MPRLEWLIMKERKTTGNPQKFQEFQSFLTYFIKKRMHNIILHAVRCQGNFRMGFVLCEFDGCKTANMRVGAHLGPTLEILMGNLP